jgi:hypothetical protein
MEPTSGHNKTAIVFLTYRPSNELIAFTKDLQESCRSSVYICIDDDAYDHTQISVRTLKYSSAVCAHNGFKNLLLYCTAKLRPCAWEKAMFHFCVIETSYDFVWFIEDDVLITSLQTIPDIDRKYPFADLLCRSNDPLDITSKWPHLKTARSLPKPWFFSMMCACRLSKNLLFNINKFANIKKTLHFHEVFFNILAYQYKLKVVNPHELNGILWRHNWDINNITLGHMYHPVKEQDRHDTLRRDLAIKNNEKNVIKPT